jgi:lipoate-protein ligase A
MASWRLLPFAWRGAAENMAVDEALLRLAPAPTVRFYGWRPGALSIGYAQDPPKGWKDPLVRRQTGGGAIWHEREVTYAVAGHEDDLAAKNDIRGLYARSHAGIVAALAEFGIEARIREEGTPRGKDAPFFCFE